MSVAFVAEVSSNHSRDLSRCMAFIDKAAEIGCDAVKFQLFKIRELFAPGALDKYEHLRRREAWELPVEFLPRLAKHCQERRIQFSCTPFYLDAVRELQPHVAFFKVASYELMWDDLLLSCARTGLPVLLSTGMATPAEIEHAVATLREGGCRDYTLLHCVSGYPAPVAECNLAAIATLRKLGQCPAGWSDHSVNPGVIYRAVHKYDAAVVEFHLDLDGSGEEFKTGHCWLPEQMAPVIAAVRDGFKADGTGEKTIAPVELPDRDWRADPTDGLRPLRNTRAKLGL